MFSLIENFITLSGEAPVPGSPVLLIRFSHCNLACTYCDTPYREEVNSTLSRRELIDLIYKNAEDYPGISILFTGGEPLLNERRDQLLNIISQIKELNFYIETNGTIPIPEKSPQNCHYVMDWKSESSGAKEPFCVDNLKYLRSDKDCIKFVVHKEDLSHLAGKIKIINEYNPSLKIYLSPQYESIQPGELGDYILEQKLPVTLSVQLHKLIWGVKRGV